jgi:hypothetical protein
LKDKAKGLDEYVPDGGVLPNEMHIGGIKYQGIWGDRDTDCVLLLGSRNAGARFKLIPTFQQGLQGAGWSLRREDNRLVAWKDGARYRQEAEIIQCHDDLVLVAHVSLSKRRPFTVASVPAEEWRSRYFGDRIRRVLERESTEQDKANGTP